MTRVRKGRSRREWSRFNGVREKSTFEEIIERKKRRYRRDKLIWDQVAARRDKRLKDLARPLLD